MSLIYNVNEKLTVFLGTIEIQAQTTVNVISTEKTVYEQQKEKVHSILAANNKHESNDGQYQNDMICVSPVSKNGTMIKEASVFMLSSNTVL